MRERERIVVRLRRNIVHSPNQKYYLNRNAKENMENSCIVEHLNGFVHQFDGKKKQKQSRVRIE